ncbi:hypothetical protein SAMN05421819_1272 [Bryocella elongata]|uniref:Uncharacterized protein n=1 Tax=Bryocella elongata TaxID=863522 RepID=A0A1H5UZ46_9BACT|nr:hypothetical protein [Bryocella elongata]SEF80266.1 hypothetical protein SAMN05421819_1272 [Bryocella elongata]
MNSVLAPPLLGNSKIQVIVSAAQVGRLASLFDRRTGVGFLMQAQRLPSDQSPGFNASFMRSACAGIEECLLAVGQKR